jgi:hypothetical protein
MVYPVSSPMQQQIPAANTFQPGGTEATKRPEENRVEDSTRPSGSDAARTEASSARSNGRVEDSRAQYAEESRARDSGAVNASSTRGTQLDLVA